VAGLSLATFRLPPWNGPWFRRQGYSLIPEERIGPGADSDEAGHAFQLEAGHRFRFEAGRGSDLMSATRRLLPRIDAMMF
jgi:hypothetical protein